MTLPFLPALNLEQPQSHLHPPVHPAAPTLPTHAHTTATTPHCTRTHTEPCWLLAPAGCCCRFTPEELAPFLQPLLEKLFAAFALPESGENEYLMKCVMRVVTFVGGWRT